MSIHENFKNTIAALAIAIVFGMAPADGANGQEESASSQLPWQAPSQSSSQPAAPAGLSTMLTKAQALARQMLPAPQSPAPARQQAPAPSVAAPREAPAVVYANAAQARPYGVEPAQAVMAQEASQPARADATPAPAWQVDAADGSIKQVLQRWSRSAGWQLVWELPVDYPVEASAAFAGGFEEAVAAVAVSMEHAEMPIKAIFYRGNKVLRIVAKGAQ